MTESSYSYYEAVDHPDHYNYGDIEVIDAIEGVTTQFPALIRYHIGNLIKYVARAPHKNELQDIEKGQWYLKRASSNVVALATPMTPVLYSISMKEFIASVINSYDKETRPFVNSFMQTIVFCGENYASTEAVLNDLAHDLELIRKNY